MIGHGNEHCLSVRATLLASFSALLLLVAGCGGEDAKTSTSGSPAELAPANSVLYAEVQIDPGEERTKEIKEVLNKVARRDVLELLVKEIDKSMKEDGSELTYREDIQPVIGQRAGLFLLNFTDDFDGAVVIDVKDVEQARKLLDESSKDDKKGDYNGVAYYIDDDGDASGIVEGRLVGGSETGFKAAVDTVKGSKLSADAKYKQAVDKLDEERLGHIYADVKGVLDAIRGALPAEAASALDQAEQQIGAAAGGGIAVGVNLDAKGLVIDAVSGPVAKPANVGGTSDLIEELPADAWLAFAAKGIIDGFTDSFQQGFREGFEQGAGGLTLEDFLRQFEQLTGVTLNKEFFESIQEVGVFVSGSQLLALKAGIVLKSSDADKLLADLKKIASGLGTAFGAPVSERDGGGFKVQIPDTPFSVAAGAKDDKVAIGLGDESVDQALEPDKTLGDSEEFKAVKEQLGDDFKPVIYVLEKPIITLIRSFGQDLGPDFETARPYIEAFKHLAIGTTGEGEDAHFKIGVGLD